MTDILKLIGWAVLIAAVLAYLAPGGLRPRLTALRGILAAAGLALAGVAFPMREALLFGTGFTAAFACLGPLWVAFRYREQGSAAQEPQDHGRQHA